MHRQLHHLGFLDLVDAAVWMGGVPIGYRMTWLHLAVNEAACAGIYPARELEGLPARLAKAHCGPGWWEHDACLAEMRSTLDKRYPHYKTADDIGKTALVGALLREIPQPGKSEADRAAPQGQGRGQRQAAPATPGGDATGQSGGQERGDTAPG